MVNKNPQRFLFWIKSMIPAICAIFSSVRVDDSRRTILPSALWRTSVRVQQQYHIQPQTCTIAHGTLCVSHLDLSSHCSTRPEEQKFFEARVQFVGWINLPHIPNLLLLLPGKQPEFSLSILGVKTFELAFALDYNLSVRR